MSLLQKRQHWQKLNRSERSVQERIAVLSTFTTNPVIPYLGLALENAGLPAEVLIGPYDQVAQQCLDDGSETACFKPTVLMVWLRLEELWKGHPLPLLEPADDFIEVPMEILDLCLAAALRWQATIVFILPAIPEARLLGVGDASNPTGVFATATAVREALRHRCMKQPGVMVLDMEEIIRAIGSGAAYNYRLLYLAHIPFSEELFGLVGEQTARLIRLSRCPPLKAIVLDGDNTLWGGVVGEDGPLGVDIQTNGPGAAYITFQEFLLELRRAGILLILCSKNEVADVWQVFERPEMRLKLAMLSAWSVSWQRKSVSIGELASKLNLGVESFVFIDDSAVEIAEVQAIFPHLTCIQMPADPVLWLPVLQSTGALDRLPPTMEDVQRTDYYQQERMRAASSKEIASPEEYLAHLKIELAIAPPAVIDLPRLAQLIAKTNQFNLNCRRRTVAEIASLCEDHQYVVRLAQARDCFGDYGIIGATIARVSPSHAELDTFVMSCRAMGRGIEEAMLADLLAAIAERSHSTLMATVEECPRNEPARTFFACLGGASVGKSFVLNDLPWPAYIKRL